MMPSNLRPLTPPLALMSSIAHRTAWIWSSPNSADGPVKGSATPNRNASCDWAAEPMTGDATSAAVPASMLRRVSDGTRRFMMDAPRATRCRSLDLDDLASGRGRAGLPRLTDQDIAGRSVRQLRGMMAALKFAFKIAAIGGGAPCSLPEAALDQVRAHGQWPAMIGR